MVVEKDEDAYFYGYIVNVLDIKKMLSSKDIVAQSLLDTMPYGSNISIDERKDVFKVRSIFLNSKPEFTLRKFASLDILNPFCKIVLTNFQYDEYYKVITRDSNIMPKYSVRICKYNPRNSGIGYKVNSIHLRILLSSESIEAQQILNTFPNEVNYDCMHFRTKPINHYNIYKKYNRDEGTIRGLVTRFNGSKFCKSSISLRRHARLENLDDKCFVILSELQYNNLMEVKKKNPNMSIKAVTRKYNPVSDIGAPIAFDEIYKNNINLDYNPCTIL
jgi:hypothetical protein